LAILWSIPEITYIMQYKGIMAVNTVLIKTIIPVFYYFKFEHKHAIGRLL